MVKIRFRGAEAETRFRPCLLLRRTLQSRCVGLDCDYAADYWHYLRAAASRRPELERRLFGKRFREYAKVCRTPATIGPVREYIRN